MTNINVKLYDPTDCTTLLSEVNFIDEEPAQKYVEYYREMSYYVVVNDNKN